MAGHVDYAVVNDWGSGVQAGITLTPDQALSGWVLEFDASYEITQIWNARIISRNGSHYVIQNLDWNASVAAGASISFGFIAGPGAGPGSYKLNGHSLAGDPEPPPEPKLPGLSISDLVVAEGNNGQTHAAFTVTLSKASSAAVTLRYTTQDGTAKAGSDYTASGGTVTFAPGETTKTITVAVLGDTIAEPEESFSLVLSDASGAVLSRAAATATVHNDDALPPSVSVADVSIAEGDDGQAWANFTVSLSGAASGPVSLDYVTQDGSARAGSDYVAASGKLSFAAGETNKTVSIAVLGDGTIEPDEAFVLALTGATGATIARGEATATIRNDDAAAPPAGAMVAYAVANDWGGGFVADVTVTGGATQLNGWAVEFDAPFTITNLWNAEIVAHTGSHYVIRNASWNGRVAASGSVSFGFQAATSGSHDVTHLTLNGASPSGPGLSALSIADASVQEGDSGSTDAAFTLTLSQASSTAVTVRFDTLDGTAKAGADFVAHSDTVTFSPGETSKTIRVAVLGDTGAEPNETYIVRLSDASGATIARDTATGSIRDDDPVTPPAPGTGHPGFYHTAGNQILDDAGHAVKIAGVNWFGFETATHAPHGLSLRSYTDMMDQMKSLGFNTIRLPFSDQFLDTGRNAPSGINYGIGSNSDLQGLSGLQLMDKIIGYAGQIGLKVILDHHRSSAGDGPNGNGLWYDSIYGEARWIENWKMLAQHYAGNTTVIGADLANEPHNGTWGDGSASDWAAAATRAGQAIQSISTDWLLIVEGIETYNNDWYWWGGQLAGVKDHPLQLANVVYSAHDYPNSVYQQPWFNNAAFPGNLEQVFDAHWGYIYRQNIAPVMIGEFGSRLTDPKDVAWLDRLTHYLAGDFNADGRSDIATGQQGISWTWWSWNPDSGDTGGILADDWSTVNPAQLNALRAIMADTAPLTGGG